MAAFLAFDNYGDGIRSNIKARACLNNGNTTKSEKFFRRTRQFFADIQGVYQEKSTQLCGKIAGFGRVDIVQTSPNTHELSPPFLARSKVQANRLSAFLRCDALHPLLDDLILPIISYFVNHIRKISLCLNEVRCPLHCFSLPKCCNWRKSR